MTKNIEPELVAKSGNVLRTLLINRVSDPGPGKQDVRSNDDQESMLREWLGDHTELPADVDVIAGDGSGERLDRAETAEAEAKIATGEYDLVLCEDLGRIFRRMQAYLFCEAAEDADTRVIALNDHVDTGRDDWRLCAFFAAMRHEMYNADTGKRIRRTQRSRFAQGSIFHCEVYGYLKQPGEKGEQGVSKDPVAEPIYDRWFTMLEDGASYSEVADWLNESGVPTGPHCRSDTWSCRMVRRVTFNPILKGVREWNRRMSRRVNSTGRRRSVIAPPDELLVREAPQLAFIDPQRYDRVITLLETRNKKYRREDENGKDVLNGRPKKRTRWPGQSVRCGVCGRLYVYGAHGQTDRLMCDGAREYRCWNAISLDAALAREHMTSVAIASMMDLPGFDDTFVARLREEHAQLDTERLSAIRDLDHQLSQICRRKTNIVNTISDVGGSRSLLDELTRLEAEETTLDVKLSSLRSETPPDLQLPSIDQLRDLALESIAGLPKESAEFARSMQRLVKPIFVFPFRLADGGHIVLRAEMRVSLASFLSTDVQKAANVAASLSNTLVVDAFEPPQREAFRSEIVQLTESTNLTEREIADRLNITQPVVQRAKKLQRQLTRLALTDPYVAVTEPPDDYSKLKRHLHKRYRFEPLDGFPRRWPV